MCLQFNGLRLSTSTPTTQWIQLFDSKFLAVFHCQKVTDHSPCLPHFLLLNAESKSSSRTDEILHYDCHVKFENNTSGRARLWDTALKFFAQAFLLRHQITWWLFCLAIAHEHRGQTSEHAREIAGT